MSLNMFSDIFDVINNYLPNMTHVSVVEPSRTHAHLEGTPVKEDQWVLMVTVEQGFDSTNDCFRRFTIFIYVSGVFHIIHEHCDAILMVNNVKRWECESFTYHFRFNAEELEFILTSIEDKFSISIFDKVDLWR